VTGFRRSRHDVAARVRSGQSHGPGECREVREEADQFRRTARTDLEDPNWSAYPVRSGDNLGDPIAGDIATGDVHAIAHRWIDYAFDIAPARVVCVEAGELRDRPAAQAECTNVRSTAWSRRGDDVRHAVAVHVSGGNADGPLECGEVGEETGQLRDAPRATDLEHANGAAFACGTGDDLGQAVAVDVARGDEHSARERRRIGVEAGNLVDAACETECAHVRTAAGSCGGDDVGQAVAVDVARGDADAAVERGIVGVEARDLVQPSSQAERAHVRVAAARPGDDIGQPVTINISARHEHTTGKQRIVGIEPGQLGRSPTGEANHADVRPATGTRARDDLFDSVAVNVAADAASD